MKRPTFARACVFALVLANTAACANTARLLEQQELALLQAQVARTDQALADFAQVPDPERNSQFSAHIPATLLNDVLQKMDGTIIDPADASLMEVRIVVERIRTRFDAALPYVEATLTACRRPASGADVCGDLSATLKATTYLDFSVSPPSAQPLSAVMKVHLTDVVPSVNVKWWQFRLQGFVRDLIKAQLAKAIAERMPSVHVPLETAFGVQFQSGSYRLAIPGPRPGSRIDAVMNTPGYSNAVRLTVFRVLFLKDGVHIFLQIT